MPTIRAFVGHSFLESDAELIRKFTDYFETLKRGPMDFDWVHATGARPEDVSIKVLELIEDRNLFVGICTRAERAINDANLRAAVFGNYAKSEKGNFKWKTSDWIIQEIGLAIGRKMNLIILLEEGVRPPGGLQGGIEHISFDRKAPEKSFQKILQMINVISSSTAPVDGGAVDQPEPAKSNLEDNKNLELFDDPEPSWDLSKYELSYIHGLFSGDNKYCVKISESYLQNLETSDVDKRGAWNAFCEFYKLTLTENGNLGRLGALANSHETNSLVQWRAAQAYLHYEDYPNAKHHFRMAVDHTEDAEQKVQWLGEIAKISQKQFLTDEVMSTVDEIRIFSRDINCEKKALSVLSEVSDWYKDDTIKVAMFERELSIDPSNIPKRFELAYLHSQNEDEGLAMYHYEKVPWNERDGLIWNNLGVVYEHFEMSGKSVDAYKQAAAKGNSLAMSNLANKLMRSGFMAEAEEWITKAQKLPNFHSNVAESLTRWKLVPEEERETKKKRVDGLALRSAFLEDVGRHVLMDVPTDLPSQMTDETLPLEISFEDGKFVATGVYEQPASAFGFANALAGVKAPQKPQAFKVEYRGRFLGRVMLGERIQEKIGGDPNALGILSIGSSNQRAIVVFPENSRKARCLVDERLSEITFDEVRSVSAAKDSTPP